MDGFGRPDLSIKSVQGFNGLIAQTIEIKMNVQVICLEEEALYSLIEQVVARLKEKHGQERDKWISDEQAMHLLNIKSKTTLQKLRDEGRIRYSQPQKKIILYDRDSIQAYLEQNARNTF